MRGTCFSTHTLPSHAHTHCQVMHTHTQHTHTHTRTCAGSEPERREGGHYEHMHGQHDHGECVGVWVGDVGVWVCVWVGNVWLSSAMPCVLCIHAPTHTHHARVQVSTNGQHTTGKEDTTRVCGCVWVCVGVGVWVCVCACVCVCVGGWVSEECVGQQHQVCSA